MSSASRIAGALSRARQAGRALAARTLEERVAAVGAVFDAWADPDGRPQRALVRDHAAHSGFSEANLRDGLALALADWTQEALVELVRAEASALARVAPDGRSLGSAMPHPVTAVLLAGSIPMPTLQQLLLPLVVGSPVIAKTAGRDPITAAHVVDSMRVLDAELAACVELVEPETDEDAQIFFSAPCVVASGSDTTLAAVRSRLTGGQRLIAHPHKLSVVVLGPGALDPGAADRVVLDASLWDQLGCLSPVAVYLVGADERNATSFSHELARAFVDREAQFPHGSIDDPSAVALRSEREEARLPDRNAWERRARRESGDREQRRERRTRLDGGPRSGRRAPPGASPPLLARALCRR